MAFCLQFENYQLAIYQLLTGFPDFRSTLNCTTLRRMESSTLHVGDRAPDFSLTAANREGVLTLSGLLANGAVWIEFLRGTW